jgi:hypothetical protein
VVLTEENVIASLDLRSGDIFWRHVIEKNDPVDELSLSLGKCESNFLFPFGGMFLIRTMMLVVFVFLICF